MTLLLTKTLCSADLKLVKLRDPLESNTAPLPFLFRFVSLANTVNSAFLWCNFVLSENKLFREYSWERKWIVFKKKFGK